MDLGIDGRTALITGGGGGMGSATAALLAAEGVKLVLSGLSQDKLDAAAAGVREKHAGAEVCTLQLDLSEPSAADRLRSIPADILVHAAGVTGAKGDPLEMTEEDWAHAHQIDFMGAVRAARGLLPGMKERGWGRAVFVTSENAAQPYPDEVVYNVAKSGILSFAKSLSMTCARSGVLVNCVAPAFVKTGMTDGMMQKRAEQRGTSMDEAVESFLDEERPHLELKRRGRPEEVAAVIAFLVSEHASFVNGANFRVDGGSVQTVNL
ncbi:SDR family NAD(P)-dependent oxidoreductase [Phycisphaera mikurensis]|uniref:Putative oxidoreductase n=1 Tax=Phycisphaera mikurensis (strain NBRC 102666 / KCTC 22515 / FYK2301M01) TaxID=1142394 RepID=I0IGG0_PHYMF|nr:SDR family oxidoreductase [Phycisphaera mikurensis]MBB6442969.1 NAD(P)-dependent dehydrogenase (short-subunit alcohol dehydrogenase family) [Phycisphaera mikurensis]BAM04348.1 putative oxidoreductase [Phycisphaera mikurensis NBRC 102666]